MEFTKKARRARIRLISIGIAAAAAVTAGIVLAVTGLTGEETPPASFSTSGEKGGESPSPSPGRTGGPTKTYTPATARSIPVDEPKSRKHGIGTGFQNSGAGVTSAAVTYVQDLDIIDDRTAREQWTAITSKDSPDTIRKGVSQVRTTREQAGLPPSGGAPDELTFSTAVKAIRSRTLVENMVEVWLVYDRFASRPDNPVDSDPLKDQVERLILKWEDGDWKVTEEPEFTRKDTDLVSYNPDSPFAWQDGWRQVSGGDE